MVMRSMVDVGVCARVCACGAAMTSGAITAWKSRVLFSCLTTSARTTPTAKTPAVSCIKATLLIESGTNSAVRVLPLRYFTLLYFALHCMPRALSCMARALVLVMMPHQSSGDLKRAWSLGVCRQGRGRP